MSDQIKAPPQRIVEVSLQYLTDLRRLLGLAANAVEKGSECEIEGMCAGCGAVGHHDHHDAHAPDCIVREIRALLGGSPVAGAPARGRPCGASHRLGYLCTRPIGHEGAHEAQDIFGRLGATWSAADQEAGEVQHLRPEEVGLPPGGQAFDPPAESFAVIRYVETNVYAPLREDEWDTFSSRIKGWALVCRGLPSLEIAEQVARALSSRPFSE